MSFLSWLRDGLSNFDFVGNAINDSKSFVAKKLSTTDGWLNVNKQKAIENGTWGATGASASGASASGSSGISLEALQNMLNAYSTSAYKAEQESVKEFRNWSEAQADLAYQRSLSSAQAQMDFQREQADIAWQRSLESANAQMAFQERMQQQAMDYQERMSSTAYQRVVKDLKKAGLNPILAISQGSASSPSVGIPSGAGASAQAMSGASASSFMPSNVKEDNAGAVKADKYVDIYSALGALLTSAGKLISARPFDFFNK